jgi:hypothetical protein
VWHTVAEGAYYVPISHHHVLTALLCVCIAIGLFSLFLCTSTLPPVVPVNVRRADEKRICSRRRLATSGALPLSRDPPSTSSSSVILL